MTMIVFIKPSHLRPLATALVVTALLGQQVAFAAPAMARPPASAARPLVVRPTAALDVLAAPAPLKKANNKQEALAVVNTAESRNLDSYFMHGGNAEDLKRLDADLKVLADANAQIGMANDLTKFESWYGTNKTPLLLTRGALPFKNLQGFFTASFIQFKGDSSSTQETAAWLSGLTNNPLVSQVSMTSFLIASGTLYFVVNILRGALTAGPAANVVGAYVDPLVRPLKENAGVLGSRHLGKAGVKLTEWFAKRSRKQTEKELSKLSNEVASAESSFAQARVLIKRMGYEMSPDDFSNNIMKLQKTWAEVNRVWGNVNTGIFKDGRSLSTDALVNRPLMFADLMMSSVSGTELFHQGIEQNIDRIIVRTGKPAAEVEALVDQLMAAVDNREKSDLKDVAAADTQVLEARQRLTDIGAQDRYVDRIVEQRRNELVFAKQTVATLAANMIHDFQYEEFNRSLPDVVFNAQKVIRSNYCLDFYHHEYSLAVSKVLKAMDFQIKSAKTIVSDLKDLAADKTTKFSDSKEIEKTNERRSKVRGRMSQLRDRTEAVMGHVRRGLTGYTCEDIFSRVH